MPSAPVPSDPAYLLVRAAARPRLTAGGREALRAAARALDGEEAWGRALYAAAFHQLTPTLDLHLQAVAEDVPERALRYVGDYTRRRSVLTLFLLSEMARVARAFEGAGVPFVVLKGPSLSEAYGGVARRPFFDNDVLISPRDFGRVGEVLRSHGFEMDGEGPLPSAVYLAVYGEVAFRRYVSGQRSSVDVHTSVVPMGYPYGEGVDVLLGRGRTIGAAGQPVPTLGWEDLFLVLALNAHKDQWNRLRLLADLAQVAPKVEDWDGVFGRAAEQGSRRVLNLAVLASAEEIGAEYPESVLAWAQRDRRAVGIVGPILGRLRARHDAGGAALTARTALNMSVPDRLRDQARYACYAAARRLLDLAGPHE